MAAAKQVNAFTRVAANSRKEVSILVSIKHCAALVLLICLIAFSPSCESIDGETNPNQPPDVWVTSGPPEGGVSSYIVHFFWHGWDKDGDVLYFEFAITDNENGAFDPADTTGRDKWHRTNAFDSTFAFSADELADSSGSDMITEFTRSHTFFIRAVDNKGLASTNPAYRSFTARTLSPTVDITMPPYLGFEPARMPVISTFRWTATDYIDDITTKQEPDSIRTILVNRSLFDDDWGKTIEYIRENPDAPEWSVWRDYQAPFDEGKSWTTPPLDRGMYIFAAQAKDEAGAVTPVFDERRNVRRIWISTEGWGPIITLCNEYYPCFKSGTHTPPLYIIEWPAGNPISFTLELYHTFVGVPLQYRHGWDVDFQNWEDEWIPYPGGTVPLLVEDPVGGLFGTHTYSLEARDNSGFSNRISVKVNLIPFTMERDLLVVDDYDEDRLPCGIIPTNGALPCDDEHDAFWLDMTQNAQGFDPAIDVIEVNRANPLPIDKLVQYKNVIWNVLGGHDLLEANLPHLYDVIKFQPRDPYPLAVGAVPVNSIALFMSIGGHVLICGEQPMTMTIRRDFLPLARFPFIFKYELGGDQDGIYDDQTHEPVGIHSFAYRDMCLDVLDIAYTDMLRTQSNGCGVTHIRGVRPREDGLRQGIPLDAGFPALTLRPEVAGLGKFFEPDSRGLNNEIYNPQYFTCGPLVDLEIRSCFIPIYGHGCLDTASPLYGSPVAVWTDKYSHVVPDAAGGVAAPSAVLGFEPYYFEPKTMREALEIILFDVWQMPRK
jgi:hypothetical protein